MPIKYTKSREFGPILLAFEAKATVTDTGEFTALANKTGIMDRGGDLILRGAFEGATEGFVKNGTILVGHEWQDMGVAMPTRASESAEGFEIAGKFHSDDESQRVRTVVAERIAAGKTVAMSIGFMPEKSGVAWFETGESMWDFLVENSLTTGVDEASVKAWPGWCRLIQKVAEIYEVSFVTVGMNQGSFVASAKSVSGDEGPHGGLTFADHTDQTLGAVKVFLDRAKDLASKKASEGKQLSADKLAAIKALRDDLDALVIMGEELEGDDDSLAILAMTEQSLAIAAMAASL
jgi:phage head maturation protease